MTTTTAVGAAAPLATSFAVPKPNAAFTPLVDSLARTAASTPHSQPAISAATGGRTGAADSRALFGDVFGALGATTPTYTAANKALAAYRSQSAALPSA